MDKFGFKIWNKSIVLVKLFMFMKRELVELLKSLNKFSNIAFWNKNSKWLVIASFPSYTSEEEKESKDDLLHDGDPDGGDIKHLDLIH